jgi:hypothetical protein
MDGVVVRLRFGVARCHDRRYYQGGSWQNKCQRGNQAPEREIHERMLRGDKGVNWVNSRGEDRALID